MRPALVLRLGLDTYGLHPGESTWVPGSLVPQLSGSGNLTRYLVPLVFWVPTVKPNPNVFPFVLISLDGLIILKSCNYIGIHHGKVLKSIF